LIVLTYHHVSKYQRTGAQPFTYGHHELSDNYYTSPVQLPIIRLLYSGAAMVPIFFVISGYVLSFRQIDMIRSKSFDRLSEMLFSSTFRRGIRLLLPSMAGITLFNMSIWLGWHRDIEDMGGFFGRARDYLDQLWMLFASSVNGEFASSLYQIWTIPVEFASSMFLVVVLCGISRLSTRDRLAIDVGLMTITIFAGMWNFFTFIGGMVIAELEAIISDREDTLGEFNKQRSASSIGYCVLWIMALLLSMLVLSYPEAEVQSDPLLWWLPGITPSAYEDGRDARYIEVFWCSLGAVLGVAALSRLHWLQRLFTTRLSLYLGDISYALYLVHYHLVLTLGKRTHELVNSIFGEDRASHLNQFAALSFELAIMYFVVIWEADLFWRYIDQPCVRLGKWAESKMRKG
jgi:peptidoglycan/LPS O-acetylase OafA/YrhL